MIDVVNRVKVYERNDIDERKISDNYCLEVKNHWNDSSRVALVIDGVEYAVNAEDLEAAIRNSVNVNRY